MDRRSRRFLLLFLFLPLSAFLTGCHSPSLSEQVRAAAPAMSFPAGLVWAGEERLGPQLETGQAFAGGGQSAGCTSCQ